MSKVSRKDIREFIGRLGMQLARNVQSLKRKDKTPKVLLMVDPSVGESGITPAILTNIAGNIYRYVSTAGGELDTNVIDMKWTELSPSSPEGTKPVFTRIPPVRNIKTDGNMLRRYLNRLESDLDENGDRGPDIAGVVIITDGQFRNMESLPVVVGNPRLQRRIYFIGLPALWKDDVARRTIIEYIGGSARDLDEMQNSPRFNKSTLYIMGENDLESLHSAKDEDGDDNKKTTVTEASAVASALSKPAKVSRTREDIGMANLVIRWANENGVTIRTTDDGNTILQRDGSKVSGTTKATLGRMAEKLSKRAGVTITLDRMLKTDEVVLPTSLFEDVTTTNRALKALQGWAEGGAADLGTLRMLVKIKSDTNPA